MREKHIIEGVFEGAKTLLIPKSSRAQRRAILESKTEKVEATSKDPEKLPIMYFASIQIYCSIANY